jgi:omega-amidase
MLQVSFFQTELFWENPTANLAMFEEKIAALPHTTDLIVLPEMFSTGFTMNIEKVAEPMNLTTLRWMKQQAAATGAVITGSFIVKENGKFYNRLAWVEPNGSVDVYDKRHLFRMGQEHLYYEAGQQKLIKTLKGWRICPLICYDLRFPVWSRNVDLAYDLLLYVANWPAPRVHVWNTLLQARAIENLSYVVGVNRIGTDGNALAYSGDSAVIDFKGERLFYESNTEAVCQIGLDKELLDAFRSKFPAHLDADRFEIQL